MRHRAGTKLPARTREKNLARQAGFEPATVGLEGKTTKPTLRDELSAQP